MTKKEDHLIFLKRIREENKLKNETKAQKKEQTENKNIIEKIFKICRVCKKNRLPNGLQKRCEECKNKNKRRCKKCKRIYKQDGITYRSYCHKCWNIINKEKQRNRVLSIEDYLKRLLRTIANDKKRSINCDLNIEQLMEIYNNQGGKCAMSGINMEIISSRGKNRNPFSLSIDRIDNDLPYTKDNIWLICFSINTFKGAHNMGDIFNIIRHIYEYNSF